MIIPTIRITRHDIDRLTALQTTRPHISARMVANRGDYHLAELIQGIEAVFALELESNGILSEPLKTYDFAIGYTTDRATIYVTPKHPAPAITHMLDYAGINDMGH